MKCEYWLGIKYYDAIFFRLSVTADLVKLDE
jgi:hypothetical protein